MKADVRAAIRLVGRTAQYGVTPDPPRSVSYSNGVLSWEQPQNLTGITHYRIYANDENHLVRVVPAGQLTLADNLTAARVLVSAYNSASDLESPKALLNQSVAPSGGGAVVIQIAYA